MDGSLDGQVALVTGASRGIGLAIVEELSRCGAAVMMVSRTEEDLRDAAGTLAPGSDVAVCAAHAGSADDAARAIRLYCESVAAAATRGEQGGRQARGEDLGAAVEAPIEEALAN